MPAGRTVFVSEPRTPKAPSDVVRYLQHRAETFIDMAGPEDTHKKERAAARKELLRTGLLKSQLSQLLNNKTGFSNRDSQEKLAAALGIPKADLSALASRWAAGGETEVEASTSADVERRFPNLAEMLRVRSTMSPGDVERLRRCAAALEFDLPMGIWLSVADTIRAARQHSQDNAEQPPRAVFERAREQGPEFSEKAWDRAWKTFVPGQEQATVEAFRKRAEVAYFRDKKSFMAERTTKKVGDAVSEEDFRHSSLPPTKQPHRKPRRQA